MRKQYWHNRGQDWIQCPDCGSDDAGMIHWMMDGEITLVCPDCDNKEWDVEGTGKDIKEKVYGDS